MSTGADCKFIEKTPGNWFYKLQAWPYGETEEYETFGPFGTFRQASDHLDKHHANPGGYSCSPLPGCPHDMLEKHEFSNGYHCNRCGDFLSSEDKVAWENPPRKFVVMCTEWKNGKTHKEEFIVEARIKSEAAEKAYRDFGVKRGNIREIQVLV